MTVTEPLRPAGLDEAVVATVAYSDIFDMPLERTRLQRFLIGERADMSDIDASLERLAEAGRVGFDDDLAYLPGREEVLAIHADRVQRAEKMWREAGRWGARLGRLPFVRSVAVTGGLACDSVADHDDIDYLIITVPGRLWTARLLCVALVHVGRLRNVDLCPNYLVSNDSLELDDRTSYSARELAQMVDIVGKDGLDDMRRRNDWFLDHLPNASVHGETHRLVRTTVGPLRRAAEVVLAWSAFDRVERWEMNRKIVRLKEVASRREEVAKPDESSFSPSVCKGHMAGNAAGIETAWRERLRGSGSQ
jgi:hypothetical protein